MRAVAVLTSVLVATLCGELVLRVAGLGYNHAPMISHPVLHHAHPPGYTYRAYHPSGEYGGHLVQFDTEGYRIPARAIPLRPVRIAAAGDSYVEALQVEHATSFVGRLETAGASRVSVRNFGVSSYSPLLYLLQWRTDIARFKPDIVILLLFSNDVTDDETYMARAERDGNGRVVRVPGPPDNPLRSALRRSHLVRLSAVGWNRMVWRWRHAGDVTAARTDSPFLEERVTLTPLTSTLLSALLGEVRGAGADLLVAAVPSRIAVSRRRPEDDVFSRSVAQWAQEQQVLYVDLVRAFAGYAGPEPLFFTHDIHWTATGHFVAAQAFCAALGEVITDCNMQQ